MLVTRGAADLRSANKGITTLGFWEWRCQLLGKEIVACIALLHQHPLPCASQLLNILRTHVACMRHCQKPTPSA